MSPDPNIEVYKQLARSPAKFVQTIFGVTPKEWQFELLEAIAENPRVAVRSGKGVGKTACLAWIALWYMVCRPSCKVIIVSPSRNQINDAIWTEMKKWISKMPPDLRDTVNVTSGRIEMGPTHFITARVYSPEKQENLQGLHDPYILALVDEASGVDDGAFESLGGIFSDMHNVEAKMVLTSNPTQLSGYFYNVFHKFTDMWRTVHVDSTKIPGVDLTEYEMACRQYGHDSDYVRVSFLGEFPKGDVNALISREDVTAAARRSPGFSPVGAVWGLDVSGVGLHADRSCLVKRTGSTVTGIEVWTQKNDVELSKLVELEWNKTPESKRPERICIDVTGQSGRGVYSILKEYGYPVMDVNVSARATTEDYALLRDELWVRAAEWFRERDASIPDNIDFINELCAPGVTLTQGNKLKVDGKDQIKKKLGGQSPDLADAFCLTMAYRPISKILQRQWEEAEAKVDLSWIL